MMMVVVAMVVVVGQVGCEPWSEEGKDWGNAHKSDRVNRTRAEAEQLSVTRSLLYTLYCTVLCFASPFEDGAMRSGVQEWMLRK